MNTYDLIIIGGGPGYKKISGSDLMQDFKKHTDSFGVEFSRDEVVTTDFSPEDKLSVLEKARNT